MSLKAFHILFVVFSVAITLGFGIWTLKFQPEGVEPVGMIWGLMSLAAAIALLVYGVFFMQKMKREKL